MPSRLLHAVAPDDKSRAQNCTDPTEDAFRVLLGKVRTGMLVGRGLGEVEQELIDPAPLDADRKAVLWLLAWSLLPPGDQIAEVEAHIELLLRAT